MSKTYVYLDHSNKEFYLSEHRIEPEELYCQFCNRSDPLIGIYESDEAVRTVTEGMLCAGLVLQEEKRRQRWKSYERYLEEVIADESSICGPCSVEEFFQIMDEAMTSGNNE